MKGFEYKCTCDWSKDDEFGFIPNTECPAHGKQTKRSIMMYFSGEIDNQQKKDKYDGSNDDLSGDTKQLQGRINKDEHMPASVDNHVDTDTLTKTSNEASRIDGCRLNSNKLNVNDS